MTFTAEICAREKDRFLNIIYQFFITYINSLERGLDNKIGIINAIYLQLYNKPFFLFL